MAFGMHAIRSLPLNLSAQARRVSRRRLAEGWQMLCRRQMREIANKALYDRFQAIAGLLDLPRFALVAIDPQASVFRIAATENRLLGDGIENLKFDLHL